MKAGTKTAKIAVDKAKTNGNGAGHEHSYTELLVSQIIPSDTEPQRRRREKFTDAEIAELAESIKANGLIQPITVRLAPGFYIEPGRQSSRVKGGMINGFFWLNKGRMETINDYVPMFNENRKELEARPPYEIVCGERRFLAVQKAGLDRIDVVIRSLTDEQVLDIQIVENLQRKDVDPIDEAYSFRCLIELGKYSIHDLAIKLGRSEKYIKQRLRLNELLPEVLAEVAKGWLPLGHAMEISKFSIDIQKRIHEDEAAYEWKPKDQDPDVLNLKDFRGTLKNEYLLSLKDAVFNVDDVRLHPEGLACSNCSQRTGFEPLLFEEELRDGDSCLNPECFSSKAKAFYQITRTAIATKLKLEPKKIEFASERGYHSEALQNEKVHTWEKLYKRKECDKAKPIVTLGGDRSGELSYVCLDSKCKKHKPQESSSSSGNSDWDKQGKEREFQSKVANTVRRKIYLESVTFFEDRLFWGDRELLVDMVRRLWSSQLHQARDVVEAWNNNAPLNSGDDKKIRKFISELDEAKLSQLVFLLVYGPEGFSGWQVADPTPVLAVNERYAKLNHKLLDAETRVELAPKEFKSQAKSYLKAVQSGEDLPIPHFWWEQKKPEVTS